MKVEKGKIEIYGRINKLQDQMIAIQKHISIILDTMIKTPPLKKRLIENERKRKSN